ncbi:MAG: CAP domain-containing protein [Planctomycetota bacterium]
MYKHMITLTVLNLFAFIALIGCGVDSGNRENGTPGGVPGLFEYNKPGPKVPAGQDPQMPEQELFDTLNEVREAMGQQLFLWCRGLGDCARSHSNDMHDRDFFDHINPEGENATLRGYGGYPFPGEPHPTLGHAGSYTFDKIVPDPYASIGELLDRGHETADDVMAAWMSSAAHRDVIFNNNFTHVGVGVYEGDPTAYDPPNPYLWTACFGVRGTGGGNTPGGGGPGGP